MDRFGSSEAIALIVLVWIIAIPVGAFMIIRKVRAKRAR